MKPVLFDFNGTLFFDADINYWAWKQTVNELTGGRLDFDEAYARFKGSRNELFLKKVFEIMGWPEDKEKIAYWAKRKETSYYHTYCYEHERNQLSPGAADLLDYLKENNAPFNLCTASIKENIDLYFDYIGLKKWFDRDLIAYDDGTFANKIDMYRACAERIGFHISDCIVIEDSPTSMMEAARAGCRNIVAMKSNDTPDLQEIRQIINDFTEFDRSILEDR